MNNVKSNLAWGVPPPFESEAPSSWLARLALSQGCSMDELLQFLELRPGGDQDHKMHGPSLSKLRLQCSLPDASFLVAGTVIAGFCERRLGAHHLLTDPKGNPRFRYCPACLKQRPVPHLDIHWRLEDWRYCPKHNCLLENWCWKCEAQIVYPCDMAASKAGMMGNASQRRCLKCQADLAATVPSVIDPRSLQDCVELDPTWLLDGPALVAALFRGPTRYRAKDIGPASCANRGKSVDRNLASVMDDCIIRVSHAEKVRRGELSDGGTLRGRRLPRWGASFLDIREDQVERLGELLDSSDMKVRLAQLVAARRTDPAKKLVFRPEVALALHHLYAAGPVSRGEFRQLTGLPQRTAERVLKGLLEDGVVASVSRHAPVHLVLQAKDLPLLLPGLRPELAMPLK